MHITDKQPTVIIDNLGRVIVTMPNGDEYAIKALHNNVYPNTLEIRLSDHGVYNSNMCVFPNVSNEIHIKTVNKSS